MTFKPNEPFQFTLGQNHPSGSCHIVTNEHSDLAPTDKIYRLNDQPIPRGLTTTEVMGILKIAQRPFRLTVLREGGRNKKKKTKSMWGTSSKKSAEATSNSKGLEEELNVVLGRDEWAPLGMTFQTCTDGAHKIIFVDPEGQGGYAGINVGDFIVGVNYKPLSFGYTHDEVVKLIRGTPKPFTLNTVRKKPDEVSGLVGQVKTSLAALETIASKDEEVIRLSEKLSAQKHADMRKDEEIANLKAQVASLQKELAVSRVHEKGFRQIEEQFEALQALVQSGAGLQPLQDTTNNTDKLSAVRALYESGKIKGDVYRSLCQLHGAPAEVGQKPTHNREHSLY